MDTLCPPFVVETATLLDVNGDQSDHCHHQHGDEPGKLSQSDEKPIKPTNDTPMAAAAKVRKRPRMPMNSSGFCKPLKTG